jgi:hypothetical protein
VWRSGGWALIVPPSTVLDTGRNAATGNAQAWGAEIGIHCQWQGKVDLRLSAQCMTGHRAQRRARGVGHVGGEKCMVSNSDCKGVKKEGKQTRDAPSNLSDRLSQLLSTRLAIHTP